MAEILKNALAYKLAIIIAVFFMINALATTCAAAFIHTDWTALTHTEKFVIVCVILGNFSNTMLAFLNKSLSRAEQGKFPIDTGDTVQITKTEITKQEITK